MNKIIYVLLHLNKYESKVAKHKWSARTICNGTFVWDEILDVLCTYSDRVINMDGSEHTQQTPSIHPSIHTEELPAQSLGTSTPCLAYNWSYTRWTSRFPPWETRNEKIWWDLWAFLKTSFYPQNGV